MLRYPIALAALCLGCAGAPDSASEPSHNHEAPAPAAAEYDLHEWGLVSVGPRGFEVAAGPGQRVIASRGPDDPMEMTLDKPVLYVHAEAPLELSVTVTPGAGLTVPEHWPPVEGPLRWPLTARPGACANARVYPSSCSTPDGYCETAELALYETDDASCLTVGERELPLLFYRLAAPAPPRLPLQVSRSERDVVVRNLSSQDAIGGIWRVRWDANRGVTTALRVATPALGQTATLGVPTDAPAVARTQMREELGAHGLTGAEAGAFMRAWDVALFGRSDAVDGDDGLSPTNDEIDTLTDSSRERGGPRVPDAILYWLPQDAITALARVEAEPAPRALRRAMLVRVALTP